MRYLIFILIAMIVVTLGVALYGWYCHLRDDKDYTYSPENPDKLTPLNMAKHAASSRATTARSRHRVIRSQTQGRGVQPLDRLEPGNRQPGILL